MASWFCRKCVDKITTVSNLSNNLKKAIVRDKPNLKNNFLLFFFSLLFLLSPFLKKKKIKIILNNYEKKKNLIFFSFKSALYFNSISLFLFRFIPYFCLFLITTIIIHREFYQHICDRTMNHLELPLKEGFKQNI